MGIPTKNIIGFGSDGCNAMMGQHNSVMSRFLQQNPGIYISKCICHSLNLCASIASQEIPRRCEDLARDVYSFFKNSPKRKAIFLSFQEFVKVDLHKILSLSGTRWLSMRKVVNRLLEQWHALRLFFVDQIFTERLVVADRILGYLNDPQVKLYFLFLEWVLPKFNKLNAYFQSERCIITKVHQRMCDTYKDLLCAYMKNDYVTKNLAEANPLEESKMMHINAMYLGADVLLELQAIRKRTPADIAMKMEKEFRNGCRAYLQVACIEMKNRYNFKDEIMSKLSLLNPVKALSPSERDNWPSLVPLIVLLPLCSSGMKTQDIDDEWRSLCHYEFPKHILTEENVKNVDVFWGSVLNLRNDENVQLFPNLSMFFLNVLSLPHSNADCERIFSALNIIKTKLRNALHISSVCYLMLAKECVKDDGCNNFIPTKAMVAANNNDIYKKVYADCDISDNVTMEHI